MHLIIRTQFDEKDYRSVEEIRYTDDSGQDHAHEAATEACMNISTCADQGSDTWYWIREQVENRLKSAGIAYISLDFDDDEPCL